MNEVARHSGKVIAAAGTSIVAALLIASMAVFGWGLFARTTADFRGETDARERTVADGSYRIQAYERFFDLCASVQTTEATIASLNEELTTGPSESRRGQIQASITAVRANRADLINTYNAEARMEGTAGHFRSSDLPFNLDPTVEATSCVAS